MKNEVANQTGTLVVATIGYTVATNPAAFYETETWHSGMAIGGAVVLVLAILNGLYALKKNMKYTGKERRRDKS